MINILLKLTKKERGKTLKKLTPDVKKRIFDNIYTMTEELELDKIDDYEIRVKMRHDLIQKFPDIVFWDYLEHWDYKNNLLMRSNKIKISTNGDIANFFVNKHGVNKLYINPLLVETKDRPYQHYRFHERSLVKHRAIATTFIAKESYLSSRPCHELVVNHKDCIRTNNRINNLEWITDKENSRHGMGHQDYKEKEYALFEVVVDCGYLGTQFYLDSDEMEAIGIPFSRIRHYKKINRTVPIRSFSIKEINKHEIKGLTKGMPNGLKILLDAGYLDAGTRNRPMKVTVKQGKYTGLCSGFITRKEAEKFFSAREISKRINNNSKYLHYGCIFEKVSLKEAISLHRKISDELFKEIVKENKRPY